MSDNGNVIHFDKAAWDELMTFVNGVIDGLEKNFIKPGPGMRLDVYLGDEVKPGSIQWQIAKDIKERASKFGDSVHAKLKDFRDRLAEFVTALKDSGDIFLTNSDLATLSASDFIAAYPDFNGGSG